MPCSLFNTLGFHQVLQPVDRKIKKRDLSSVLKEIIQKSCRDFQINLPGNSKKVLKKDGVLLICNHPAQAEVLLLLAAIPKRSNFFLVIMHGILSILPSADKHLIPVYISHRLDDQQKPDWKYNLLKKIHFIPEYSQEVAHQKNIQSINLAAEKIDNSSLVAIFPAGGSENKHDFLPGVGYIVKSLKHPQKSHLLMAHVSGTSSWDFLRLIPFFNKFLPKFRIDFSEPSSLDTFSTGTGREISFQLQQYYDSWSRPYEPLPKFKYAALYLRSFLLFLIFQA